MIPLNIKNDLTQLIGGTPMIYLTTYSASLGLPVKIAAKLEYFNPLGSVKDRAAFAMIADAEKRGLVNKDTLIVEPTSGNTGIGLAFVCAARGYHLVLTMPETMSKERRTLLAALGADLILTDGTKGMQGAIDKAHEIAAQTPNSFIPQQFKNPANPAIHTATTAKEILMDTDGQIELFVATFGTGGTVSGVGRALKQANPAVRVVAVEPAESPLVTEGRCGPHGIQGIGANFVPENLDLDVIDEVLTVTTRDAYAACRAVGKQDGLLVGISSGAAIQAAAVLARRPENAGKLITALLPDTGERYLSSGLYE